MKLAESRPLVKLRGASRIKTGETTLEHFTFQYVWLDRPLQGRYVYRTVKLQQYAERSAHRQLVPNMTPSDPISRPPLRPENDNKQLPTPLTPSPGR